MAFEEPNNFLSLDKINEKSNKENQQKNPFEKNDFIIKEKFVSDNHKPISLKQTEKIVEQLKNNICNIFLGGGERGTGFFMKIKFPEDEHLLPVLLTCNHVINKSFLSKNNNISILINGKTKKIGLKNRIIYNNEKLDVTIIELKEKDEINDFLILDEENQDIKISGQTIYILQYLNVNEPYVDFGKLNIFDKSKFTHSCNTQHGSSGSPILNLETNKVIGIHIGCHKNYNYNLGIFLNNPLNDFIKKKYHNIIEENEFKFVVNLSTKIMHFEDSEISKDDDYKENEKINTTSENDLCLDNFIYEKKFVDKDDILYLNNIGKDIKILNLTCNNLSDLKILQKIDCEKSEKLYLDNNKISDINILEKFRFKELKELYLNANNISNIEILEKVNIPNLEILDLSCNQIINIDVFAKVNFPKLRMISFHKNKITNIDKIKLAKFENLELLSLAHNENLDSNPLKYSKFKKLQYLFLTDTNLKTLDTFCSNAFKHLKILALGGNNISNIKTLSKLNLKELEDLTIYDNYISDIEILSKVNFPKLKLLNLASNSITNIEVFKKVNFPELYELNLQQNNIADISVFKNCKFKKLFKLNIKLNKIDMDKNLDIINELKSKLKLFK